MIARQLPSQTNLHSGIRLRGEPFRIEQAPLNRRQVAGGRSLTGLTIALICGICAGPGLPLTPYALTHSAMAQNANLNEDFRDETVLRNGFRVTVNDQGILICEGQQKVLFYQRSPKSRDGRFERASYVHPLYDLDGVVLTEDFPEDHLHHRGIFWAWHQIWVGEQRIGDSWLAKDFQWEVADANVFASDEHSVMLMAEVDWKSPNWTDSQGRLKPLAHETFLIRVHKAQENHRKLDFQLTLVSAVDGLRIGGSEDEKGYGGFSVRVRLPEDVAFRAKEGIVEPQRTAMEAGPWMDVTASYGESDDSSGVTMLTHPSLPPVRQPWILRQRRSMQNPVFPGNEPVLIARDEPLKLAYRLVVHRGTVQQDEVEKWQAEFAAEELPTTRQAATRSPATTPSAAQSDQ